MQQRNLGGIGKPISKSLELKKFYKEYEKEIGEPKYCECYGISNSAQVVDQGIQIGNVNLEAISADPGCFIFSSVLKFPPTDEVYFAIHVRTESDLLTETLKEMKSRAGEVIKSQNFEFNSNNKNVKIALAHDGRIYLKNKKQWDSLDVDLQQVGGKVSKGIAVDQITVAVYPPTPSVVRSLAVSEFIAFLASCVGEYNVHYVSVWPRESGTTEKMRRQPRDLEVSEIRSSIERMGGFYPDELVENFHVALNYLQNKHFVILGGISGTGKTQLALQYARAVHGVDSMEEEDPFLFMCPVRPEWTEPSSLTGYHDVLTGRYVVPTFLEAVLVAISNPESPVFVCIDEMNLARVEYYFSDVLSCMEAGKRLKLHSNITAIEASTGGQVVAEVPFPSNLYIIGTVNIDETTNPFSDKVLDRAIYVDLSSVDLYGFYLQLKSRSPELEVSIEECGLLIEVNNILGENRQGFGYRLAEECIRYHHFAVQKAGAGSADVLDDLLVQKVLVKLRGSEYERDMLTELSKILDQFPKATDLLANLRSDLDQLGSFQNSR